MQTDSHIEIVSPNSYYTYSRHRERIFCNYESLYQTSAILVMELILVIVLVSFQTNNFYII